MFQFLKPFLVCRQELWRHYVMSLVPEFDILVVQVFEIPAQPECFVVGHSSLTPYPLYLLFNANLNFCAHDSHNAICVPCCDFPVRRNIVILITSSFEPQLPHVLYGLAISTITPISAPHVKYIFTRCFAQYRNISFHRSSMLYCFMSS